MAALGAALLWLLKALGILLGVVLALVLALLLVPMRAWLRWEEGSLSVSAGLLGLKLPILKENAPVPWLQKLLARRPAKRKAKPAAPPAQKPAKAPPPKKEKLRLTVDELCVLAGGAGRFLRAVLGTLRITQIRLYLPVHGEDAAATAIQYGKTQAWLHGALGVLNNVFWLEFQECRLAPDYTGELAGRAHFSCRVSAQMLFFLIAAGRLLWLLINDDILDRLL